MFGTSPSQKHRNANADNEKDWQKENEVPRYEQAGIGHDLMPTREWRAGITPPPYKPRDDSQRQFPKHTQNDERCESAENCLSETADGHCAIRYLWRPNGWRVSGELRREAEGRVRCTRGLGRCFIGSRLSPLPQARDRAVQNSSPD
jgi:hypothetical protein